MKLLFSTENDAALAETETFANWMKKAAWVAGAICVLGVAACFVWEKTHRDQQPSAADNSQEQTGKETKKQTTEPPVDLHKPVRPAPKTFPPDSNMPRGREIYASGPIDLKTFDEARDIVRFEDKRVWFDSDQKTNPVEDDHLIHRAMEIPLKRLVNLLEQKGGKLKVHDAYRPAQKNTIHLQNSLHCEGRAIDLTCEKVNLSELAKLCWQAGFDFVLYEVPRTSGVHLHCSVKRAPDAPLPPRPK